MNKQNKKVYQAEVLEILESGEAILQLPQEMLDDLKWVEGDTLWLESVNNTIIFTKMNGVADEK